MRLRKEGIMRRGLCEKRVREIKKYKRVIKTGRSTSLWEGNLCPKTNTEVRNKLMLKLKKESRQEEGWKKDH